MTTRNVLVQRLLTALLVLSLLLAAPSQAQWQRGGLSRSFNTYSPPPQPRYTPPRPMMPQQMMAPRAPQMAPRTPQFNTSARGPTMAPGSTSGIRMARPLPLPPSIRQNSAIAQMPSYTQRVTTTGAPIVVSRTKVAYSVPQQGVFGTRIVTTYRPIRIALIQKFGSGRVAILQQRLVRISTNTQASNFARTNGGVQKSASERRNSPGMAISTGNAAVKIEGKWLRGSQGNLGLFPTQIAQTMVGKTYKNFDEFRQSFWKQVSRDSELANQFSPSDQKLMAAGFAPLAPQDQHLGGQKSYVLHHKTPINQGGGVYDVDNIVVVTPKYHASTLESGYHYGR